MENKTFRRDYRLTEFNHVPYQVVSTLTSELLVELEYWFNHNPGIQITGLKLIKNMTLPGGSFELEVEYSRRQQ